MNKHTMMAGIFITMALGCKQTENAPTPHRTLDPTLETEAIMRVIDNETTCFFDGNYTCWAQSWSHEPYTMQAWNSEDGTYSAAIGWEAISAQSKKWIEENYQSGKNIVHASYKRTKPIVKFFNDSTAYLIWKQYNANNDNTYYKVSQESRIMEKKVDGWKIVNVTGLWDAKSHIPLDSLQF